MSSFDGSDLQVLIMLVGDPSYKFVHVEDFGYVVSYAPRTSFGDFQTMLPVSDRVKYKIYVKVIYGIVHFINGVCGWCF